MKAMNIFLGMFLMIGLMSCSSIFVKSDYDRESNFANYKIFDWMPHPQKPGFNPLAQHKLSEKQIKSAVYRELTARGYQEQTTGKPDFLIFYTLTFADRLEDKLEETLHAYSYRGYSYKGFYGAGAHDARQDNEDTPFLDFLDLESNELVWILDFIDPESKQLVWQGWYVGAIEDPGITEVKINKTVKHVLAEFRHPSITIAGG